MDEIQEQNQSLLEAVKRAANGDLDLVKIAQEIDHSVTSFDVRGHHSRLSAFRGSPVFDSLPEHLKELWWALVCRCSAMDQRFHSLGFKRTGVWSFQDIRVSFLPEE